MTTYRAAYLAARKNRTSGGFVLTGPAQASLSDTELRRAALLCLAEYNADSYKIGEEGATEADIIIGEWRD